MTVEEFVSRFGAIYESSPWVARQTWARRDAGIDTPDGLCAVMRDVVDSASLERRLALIRAHPDLAGRAARAGRLTDASTREQSGAGLDQCTDDEYEQFHRLNTAYQERFGFPFIVAVAGLHRRDILDRFRSRLGNAPDEEFDTAMAEVHRIARVRVMACFQEQRL